MLKRRNSKSRLECFLAGMDILRHSKKYTPQIIEGVYCIEIIGLSKDGEEVFIHLREEQEKGDKKLYFISTFY